MLVKIYASLGKLPMNDLWVFMPFISTNPHLHSSAYTYKPRQRTYLPECTQPSQNTPSNPRGILALSRGRDANLHILHGQLLNLAH